MENFVSFSPHIKNDDKVNKAYIIIAISLVPAFLAGTIIFGFRSLLILLISLASVVGSEIVFNYCRYKKFVFNDYSTILTGLLIALMMPPKVPVLYPVLGAVLSNVLVKNCMGGVGRSIVNEATFAKVVTFTAFSNAFNCYKISGGEQTSTTLLGSVLNGAGTEESVFGILLGKGVGSIGETAILFLLVGGIVLCVLKVVDYKIPVIYLTTILLMSMLCFGVKESLVLMASGGAVLCAFYLLTDYSCMPKTLLGKLVYGLAAGVVTVLYWRFGKMPDLGAFYAVLIVGIVANAVKGFYRPKFIREKK